MTNQNSRSAAAIQKTRQVLTDLKHQDPRGLRAFVIDLALAYPDPLDFWGERCDIEFIKQTISHLKGDRLLQFYEAYCYEIEEIEYNCLRSPYGGVPYDAEYVAYFAIEHTAFHLRQCLPE